MVKIRKYLICLLAASLLYGCAGSNDEINSSTESSNDVKAEEKGSNSSKQTGKGTLSDPFPFSSSITVTTNSWEGDKEARFTFNFENYIDSETLEKMYEKNRINGNIAIDGVLTVESDETDSDLDFSQIPSFTLLTEDMNEYAIHMSAKSDVIGQTLSKVYPGGTYNILLLSNDITSDVTMKYLRIDVPKESGEQTETIWVLLPETFSELDVKTSAELLAEEIEAKTKEVQIGDIIQTDFVEISLGSFGTAQELYPPDTSGSFTYKKDVDGETYVFVEGTIKNTSNDTINGQNQGLKFTLNDGKVYYGTSLIEDGQTFFGYMLSPEQTANFYYAASVPDEVAQNITDGSLTLIFKENFEYDSGISRGTDFTNGDYFYSIPLK